MSKKDLFGDEPSNQGQDFKSLFESSVAGGLQRPKVGDGFQAEILSIGREEVFVKLNSATEGILLVTEILDKEKNREFKVGDLIDVVVTRVRDGEYRVSRKGNKKSNADLDSLEDAYDMELPVEGRVIEPCNGGYRVQVMNATAFCPISQIDFRVSTEPDAYVGKKFDFIITQFDARKKNVVVSRRKLLDLQRAENEGETLNRVKPDDLLDGKITRVETYGAFCEIEAGIEGLIHVSELSWSRTHDARLAIQPGANVRVRVLKIEDVEGRLKISLSIKQGGSETDPWIVIEQNYPVGSNHEGTVEKKEVYGLFVNIGPGVTGLLPKSKWRDHLESKTYDSKKAGDKVKVRVDQINLADHKMSLGPAGDSDDESWKAHTTSGKTTGKLGTFADLLKKAKAE